MHFIGIQLQHAQVCLGSHLSEYNVEKVSEAVTLMDLVHDKVCHTLQALWGGQQAQQDAIRAEHQAGLRRAPVCMHATCSEQALEHGV